MMPITHVFFDIGGVLGTNGWDREQRSRALDHFGLDESDFQYRHEETVGTLESGRLTLDEYLDITVFGVQRHFTKEEFREYMKSQSEPFPESIAVARAIAEGCKYWVSTMNNESDELNRHRIEAFGLTGIFDSFLSSCWLGVRKPARAYYDRVLSITQAKPSDSVFIDDREQNLEPARMLGMNVVHYISAEQMSRELTALGVEFTIRQR